MKCLTLIIINKYQLIKLIEIQKTSLISTIDTGILILGLDLREYTQEPRKEII